MLFRSQWFERTLDDSANKRISVPEAFLSVDAILSLYINIILGCKVYPRIIEKHLNEELPFMATETILMYCVKEKNGDRQELHEAIRKHSVATAEQVKLYGNENDLIARILSDNTFNLTESELNNLLNPQKFIGFAAEQTSDFLNNIIYPLLEKNKETLGIDIEIKV